MPDPRFQLDGRTHCEWMFAGDYYLAEDPELMVERRWAVDPRDDI